MYGVTNTTKGPRFVYAQGEPKLIEAGETAPFDLTDSEIGNVQRQVDAGVLAWDGEAPALQAKADAPVYSTAADLLAAPDGMNFMAYKSAASKILGVPAPATKPEIVAALQAKAEEDAKAQA